MFSRDGAAEQERLLRHDAHLAAQRARGDVAQVVPVDQHAPLRRVVEARGRASRRSTCPRPWSRRARRSGPAGTCRSTSSSAGSPSRRVGEGHVLEADLAARRAAGRPRPARRAGRAPRRAARRSCPAPPCPPGRSCRAGRAPGSGRRSVQRGDEGDEHADGDVALDRPGGRRTAGSPAVDEAGKHLDAREVRGVEVDRRHVRVAVLVVELGEAPLVPALLGEGAHDADARQRLLQVGGDGARASRA